MLGSLSYFQKVWKTCGVQSSACPSVREAERGLASTESGEAEQVAGYLLGPHGTLRYQLGKLGLSASRLVVLIKGWAGERWEIAPGSSLAGGRQVFLSRCFWALWGLPPPASWESCSVRVSDHFLSFSPQFLTWHLLKWVISWSVIILITSGVSVGRFALSNSTVFCSSYQ